MVTGVEKSATIIRKRNAIHETFVDKFFNIFSLAAVTLFFILVFYPMIYVVSASFSSGTALIQGKVWLWPVDFTTVGFTTILKTPPILRGYGNSIVYMVVGTLFNVAMTTLAAYPLAQKKFCGRGLVMFLFMFTMMFGGGLIPSYLLVRSLGMIDTIWALVVPGALSVWNMTIMMNFFRTSIPSELIEAAKIDGCGDIYSLFRIVLPLSKSILAVMALFYAVGHWNSYFSAMIYLTSAEKLPLQLVLRDVLVQNSMSSFENLTSADIEKLIDRQNMQQLLKYALIVVSTAPMMMIYPFIQKHFVKGVLIGSIKG